MRSFLMGCLCVLAVAVAPACSSNDAASDPQLADIQVRMEVDRNTDLSEYKTYAWAAAAAMVRDPKGQWTPSDLDIGNEIVSLVDRELRNKGRAQVVDKPDMIAVFAVGVDMKANDIEIDPEDGTKNFTPSPKGGVMIALADTETRRVIWAGRAMANVTENPSVELVQKRLDHAIKEMFAKFPR